MTDSVVTTSAVTSSGGVGGSGCDKTRKWWIFLAASLVTWAGGLIIILSFRVVKMALEAWKEKKRHVGGGRYTGVEERQAAFLTRVKWINEEIISGDKIVGKVVISVGCLFSIGSLIIYFYDISLLSSDPVTGATLMEYCQRWDDTSTAQPVDFAFNMYFLVYFFLRFIAANDKLMFWMEIHSLVDYFTIPPIFVSIALGRQWIGMRFLRALRLITFPDILQYLSILRSHFSIRLTQIALTIFAVWLASAGFIHLLENSGDPPSFSNARNLSFYECIYVIIVTMTTVGYGDITCQTALGRGFIMLFLLGGIALFATYIPELSQLISQQTYKKSYDKPVGSKHIIVCGHLVYETARNFLHEFLHEDRKNLRIKCVFLDSIKPGLELEALYKRHHTGVIFLQGSVMNVGDLDRAQLATAEAVIILANARSSDQHAEDMANILRVISVKNYCPSRRIIVQILHFQNKSFCYNIPSWTSQDLVICLTELKLSFMAQACQSPGFSTLVANLFVTSSYKASKRRSADWHEMYFHGAGNEVHSSYFSEAFNGLTFPQTVRFCHARLGLLLFAVKVTDGKTSRITVNPGEYLTITDMTKGFFICQTWEEAQRAEQYCHLCHRTIPAEKITKCNCVFKDLPRQRIFSAENDRDVTLLSMRPITEPQKGDSTEEQNLHDMSPLEKKANRKIYKVSVASTYSVLGETNGVFTPEKEMSAAEACDEDGSSASNSGGSSEQRNQQFQHGGAVRRLSKQISSHIMEMFDRSGLYYWCPPRSIDDADITSAANTSTLVRLQGHVVLGVFSEAGSLLLGLCNFLMPLRASNIPRDELLPIVIVGSKDFIGREWHMLKNFPEVYVKDGSPLNRADLRYVRLSQCEICVLISANGHMTFNDPTLVDKEVILCSLNIKTMSFRKPRDLWKSSVNTVLGRVARATSATKKELSYITGDCIQMLVELGHDSNVQFIDQDDIVDKNLTMNVSQPFSQGRAFGVSLLDALVGTAFYDIDALELIRNLISGGSNMDLEQAMTEGQGIMAGDHTDEELEDIRDKSRLNLLRINNSILADLCCETYGQMFAEAFRRYSIICLGLFRKIDVYSSKPTNRVVITNPPSETILHLSDKVYCLCPFRLRRFTSTSRLPGLSISALSGLLRQRNTSNTSRPSFLDSSNSSGEKSKEHATLGLPPVAEDDNSLVSGDDEIVDNSTPKLEKHKAPPLSANSTRIGPNKDKDNASRVKSVHINVDTDSSPVL